MCLAIPAKIIELEGTVAVVEMSGVRRRCQTVFVPELAVGDYVLIHAGFAIQKWTEADVQEYNAIIDSAVGEVSDD